MELKASEIASGTARTVEPFAFSAKWLVTGSLLNILGVHAITGLAVRAVVVDL
jgi:hypothetical protein